MLSRGCLLTLLVLAGVTTGASDKLMVIVLGGFRWDYFNIHTFNTHGFSRAFEGGVRADFLTPSFPTLASTNLYSIMTGLYPESHGILGDAMWDPEIGKLFSRGDKQEQRKPYWWDGGEPLWVTAEKQGKRAYMMNWPACDVVIRGVKPTSCQPHSGLNHDLNSELQNFIIQNEAGLELLKNDTADLVGIYFEVSEYVANLHTPTSPESKGVSRWLDNEFEKLAHEINSLDLEYDVNVIVMSDHGVVDVAKKKILNITDIVKSEDAAHVVGHGAVASIWPEVGKEEELYDKLNTFHEHLSVYKKDGIPDRWHYRDNIRIPPITLVADMGWMITTANEGFPKSDKGRRFRSFHGYDNNEVKMRGIFFGLGPNLKRGSTLPGIANVHLYQLMCRILRITAAPNNGTWALVHHVFIKTPYRPLITWKRTFTYGPFLALVLLAAIVYYIKFREHSDKSKEV